MVTCLGSGLVGLSIACVLLSPLIWPHTHNQAQRRIGPRDMYRRLGSHRRRHRRCIRLHPDPRQDQLARMGRYRQYRRVRHYPHRIRWRTRPTGRRTSNWTVGQGSYCRCQSRLCRCVECGQYRCPVVWRCVSLCERSGRNEAPEGICQGNVCESYVHDGGVFDYLVCVLPLCWAVHCFSCKLSISSLYLRITPIC